MKALKLTALFAFAAFAFVSCSKDDSPAGPTYAGSASYEGTTYQIDKGYFGTGYDSTNQVDIGAFLVTSLAPSSMTSTANFNYVYFEYLQTTVTPGTYTFLNNGTVSSTKNFVYGEVVLNANTSKQVGVLVISPSTITVTKDSDTKFKIDYDLTVEGGKKVTGTYTGTFAAL